MDDGPSVALQFLCPISFPSPFQPLLLTPPSTTYFIIREGLQQRKAFWLSQWRRWVEEIIEMVQAAPADKDFLGSLGSAL